MMSCAPDYENVFVRISYSHTQPDMSFKAGLVQQNTAGLPTLRAGSIEEASDLLFDALPS